MTMAYLSRRHCKFECNTALNLDESLRALLINSY